MNPVTLCASWLVGCALGLLLAGAYPFGLNPGYASILFVLAGITAVPTFFARDNRALFMVTGLGAVALLGCARALLSHAPITERALSFYNGPDDAPKVMVVGVVSAEPYFTDRSQRIRISVEGIRLPGEIAPGPVDGDALVVVSRYPEYEIGTRLSLSGTLTAPPQADDFDYAGYLARQGIRSYMFFPRTNLVGTADVGLFDRQIAGVRARVRDALRRGVPEPQAALAVGVVTGDRSSIPNKVRLAFQLSGTQHIMVISGQNIALLVGVVYLFFGRGSKRRLSPPVFGAVVLLLAAYTAFTGGTPPVARAAAMGVLVLLAPVVKRRPDPVAALGLAAAVMALIDPDVLFDSGFQLSFAAMGGVVLLGPTISDTLTRRKLHPVLALPLAVSIAAQAATLPLVLAFFGRLPLVGLPATMTADLALLPLMITGIVAGIVGGLIPPLAPVLGLAVWPWAAWLLWWVEFWGSLPWASVEVGRPEPWVVASYYVALGGLLWLAARRRRKRLYAEGNSQ